SSSLPAVISSSRLDAKKNIRGLVKAFAESLVLQQSSNLVIVTRGFDNPLKNYRKINQGRERDVLIDLISLIDQNNLRGKVSMFSIDNQSDLADMYRYFSLKKAVFSLMSLYEPFGLAPLEAMACGLPVVVTKFGGPAESLRDEDQDYGLLVDPKDPEDIASAIYSFVSSKARWKDFSQKGYIRVLDQYTWRVAAESYLSIFKSIVKDKDTRTIFNFPIDDYFIDPDAHYKPSLNLLNKIYLEYDILCAGATVVDFISVKKTNSLREADTFKRFLGGNPAYVAVYTSKLSKKAALLTKIGKGQFGGFLERELQKNGVCTEHISYTDETDTSVAFLSQTPTTPDFQCMHSSDRKLSIKDIDPDLVERAKIIHTSLSSLSHEPSRSAIRKILRIAKKNGQIISIEPNYQPQIWRDKEEAIEILTQICYGMTFVMPSITDARHIFDYNLEEKKLVKLCINKFHEWGARTVIMTAKGRYVAISENGRMSMINDLPKVDVLDVTGAGAAFTSGFLVAYLEKLPLNKCVYFGHHVAKIALQSIGPFPKSIFRKDILKKIS
ncbi:PfkB family carbohydrate kinase, partial [Elusimicrobiota bacterium]